MWEDPIVQETRQLREAFASQYGHDPDAIFQAILEKQSLSQRPKVSYPRTRQTMPPNPALQGTLRDRAT
jgi:hypothetical protein